MVGGHHSDPLNAKSRDHAELLSNDDPKLQNRCSGHLVPSSSTVIMLETDQKSSSAAGPLQFRECEEPRSPTPPQRVRRDKQSPSITNGPVLREDYPRKRSYTQRA